ncbi:LON peptidase substrate-binding domain-containing protein [Solimonas terrae]|uniref:Peptidase S16 n=1 Tax=Solimonas terrae TaxID=1396819 RepID=A0A6M2BPR6_9GAMM|nr:LON peptidase substrate-binding domain-containing protein [Solimonas terrae]NGY04602.1 peptidase S16 [Solimonas terrae]
MRTQEIPIFPLGTVLFPAGRLPLRIFEPRYVDMTRRCIADDAPFGVCLIRGGYETGVPAIPWPTGCSARIAEWDVPGAGLFTIVAEGETVFRIRSRRTTMTGLIIAEIEWCEAPAPMPVPDRHASLVNLLRSLIDDIGAERFPAPPRFEDAGWVGCRLAELLPVVPERKQALLELDDPLQRLDALTGLIKTLRD